MKPIENRESFSLENQISSSPTIIYVKQIETGVHFAIMSPWHGIGLGEVHLERSNAAMLIILPLQYSFEGGISGNRIETHIKLMFWHSISNFHTFQ